MERQELAARHIALREQAGLTQEQEAKMAGVSPTTVSGIESGKITRPHLRTLLKIARALDADVGELRDSGKVEAPPSPTQPPLNGFGTAWEAAVVNASALREGGQARMAELLSTWRASREHQEDPDERRECLDEMGDLLQKAWDAATELVRNYTLDLERDWDEVRDADRFYYLLRGMVEGQQGLFIRVDSEGKALEIREDAA